MKNLIVYYSKTGNNDFLAKELGKRLACPSERITEKRKRTTLTLLKEMLFRKAPEINDIKNRIDGYDHLILIAPVWGGTAATPLIAFINKCLEEIKDYSMITVCGGALGENAKLADRLAGKIGKKPRKVTQLYINSLLPDGRKNKTKFTSSYKIGPRDIESFRAEIDTFIESCS